MMDIFRKIAERKIEEAMARGEFEGLSGAGKPLDLDDDRDVPPDLRGAYRILKNAGCLPPELELKKEIAGLRELIMTLDDEKERLRAERELSYRMMKFSILTGRSVRLDLYPLYEEALVEKVAGRRPGSK